MILVTVVPYLFGHGKKFEGAERMEMRHIVRSETVDVFALNKPIDKAAATLREQHDNTSRGYATLPLEVSLCIPQPPHPCPSLAGCQRLACAYRSSIIGKMPMLLLYRASILREGGDLTFHVTANTSSTSSKVATCVLARRTSWGCRCSRSSCRIRPPMPLLVAPHGTPNALTCHASILGGLPTPSSATRPSSAGGGLASRVTRLTTGG